MTDRNLRASHLPDPPAVGLSQDDSSSPGQVGGSEVPSDGTMTWKEFKDAIEAQGVKDEDRFLFIDYRAHREFPPKVKITTNDLFKVT